MGGGPCNTHRRFKALIALITTCILLAAGCKEAGPPADSKPFVTLGASLPVRGRESISTLVDTALVREQLMGIAWDGRPAEKLAHRWQALSDGYGVRIFLRPNVKFHDGNPLTSQIVAGLIRDAAKSGVLGLSSASVVSVEAEGGDAIVIRTSQQEAFLLADLADLAVTPPNQPNIGTGPYMVGTATDTQVEMQRFADYYRGTPVLERVTVRSYETLRSAWAAMMRGEIDGVHEVSRDAVEFVEAESTVRNYSFLRAYYTALMFNLRHPVLGNPEVRRALNVAIDRDAVVRLAMRGQGQPAYSPVWPNYWAYTAAAPVFAYNPEAAMLRLDAAGYKHRTNGAGQMPSRFAFTCLVRSDGGKLERLAMILQKQLYDVGVDMQVQPMNNAELGPRIGTGQYDAVLTEATSGRSPAWVYHLWRSATPDRTAYLDTGYKGADAALDRLRRAVDDDATRAAMADVQRVFYEDPPAVFLAWSRASRALSAEFTVPKDPPDILGSLWQWRRTGPQQARR